MSEPCPTCKRDKYITKQGEGLFRCGWCGETLHETPPAPKKSKPKSTKAKNKMETPNDPLEK